MTLIKTREPGAAFLNQTKTYTPTSKNKRPWRELGHEEPDQNQTITEPKLDYKPDQNQTITEPKLDYDVACKKKLFNETEPKLDRQLDHDRGQNQTITEPKTEPRRDVERAFKRDLQTIVGNDRKTLIALFHSARINGSRETSLFSRKALAEQLSLKYLAVRSSLRRLKEFGFLKEIRSGKGGPGAYVIAIFDDEIFRTLMLTEPKLNQKLNHELNQNWTITESKLDRQLDQTDPVVVDNINNNINTTTTQTDDLLKKQAKEIYIYDPLLKAGIGESHIIQLLKEEIPASDIQRSLAYLAFQIGRTEHNIKNPVALFMSGMRNHGCLTPPAGYSQWAAQIKNNYENQAKSEPVVSYEVFDKALGQKRLDFSIETVVKKEFEGVCGS